MAQKREVAQAWLIAATLITVSFAAHSPTQVLAQLNIGVTLACLALTVLHALRSVPDRLAVYLCSALVTFDLVCTAVMADGFAGMSMLWPISAAFPTLALLGRHRFVWIALAAVLISLGVAWAEIARLFEVSLDVATKPDWWLQTLAWMLLLLVALPALMHYWQLRYLGKVHQQSLSLEQMSVELDRQTLRQHRFLAHVVRFFRAPLHEVWLDQEGPASPIRSGALMAAVHDLYSDLANLQDSGALDAPEWSQSHSAPLNTRSFIQGFQDHPPYPVRELFVRGVAEIPLWVLIDQKRLSQLFTNLLWVASGDALQVLTPHVSHEQGQLQIRFQWASAEVWLLSMEGVLAGDRQFPVGLEGVCLRLLISQQLAQTMGGELAMQKTGEQRGLELCLSLPAPSVATRHVTDAPSQRLQIAFVAADGAAPRELHELFRAPLLGEHAWRRFKASTLPDLGFDVVILILDDWDPKEESTRQFLERLRLSNAQIWGVTNGLSIEQVSDWRALAVQRIWLRPIDDTAWQYHLRGTVGRAGAAVEESSS